MVVVWWFMSHTINDTYNIVTYTNNNQIKVCKTKNNTKQNQMKYSYEQFESMLKLKIYSKYRNINISTAFSRFFLEFFLL